MRGPAEVAAAFACPVAASAEATSLAAVPSVAWSMAAGDHLEVLEVASYFSIARRNLDVHCHYASEAGHGLGNLHGLPAGPLAIAAARYRRMRTQLAPAYIAAGSPVLAVPE